MMNLFPIPLQGLTDAASRAVRAASNILKSGAEAVEAATLTQGSRAYREAGGETAQTGSGRLAGPATLPPNQAPPLEVSIVEMKQAAHAYAANSRVLESLDETLQTVTDKSL